LLKASSPILVTACGILILVKEVLEKALSPILVTGDPANVLGIVTSPSTPVYPVI